MGQITGINADGIKRIFSCGQYALLGNTLPDGFVVTENTCGVYFNFFRSPFASFGLEFSGTSIPGGWYEYKSTIASNEITVPSDVFTLPGNPNNVMVIVRRQQYHPDVPGDERDFFVNTTDNKIQFRSALGLNGQTAYIRVFK